MKQYTDLEQSRKLAKILPIETADMYYHKDRNNDFVQYPHFVKEYQSMTDRDIIFNEDIIPCWSLTALLATLPNEIITDNKFGCNYQIDIRKYDGGDSTTLYQIAYGNNRGSSGSWHDMINTGEKESLIDCCVQMILKLNELNLCVIEWLVKLKEL